MAAVAVSAACHSSRMRCNVSLMLCCVCLGGQVHEVAVGAWCTRVVITMATLQWHVLQVPCSQQKTASAHNSLLQQCVQQTLLLLMLLQLKDNLIAAHQSQAALAGWHAAAVTAPMAVPMTQLTNVAALGCSMVLANSAA